MTPGEFRAEMRHRAQVAIEQGAFTAPCSRRQASFLASLWGAALRNNGQNRKASYHTVLRWLWGVDTARNLSRPEATITIDWLLGNQPTRADFPMPCAEAVAMSAAILETATGV